MHCDDWKRIEHLQDCKGSCTSYHYMPQTNGEEMVKDYISHKPVVKLGLEPYTLCSSWRTLLFPKTAKFIQGPVFPYHNRNIRTRKDSYSDEYKEILTSRYANYSIRKRR